MIIRFSDHPEFTPNISPRQMFERGILGGTYWRELENPFDGKTYKNEYKKIKGLSDLPESIMSSSIYDSQKNKYKVKAGSSFETWVKSNWIRPNAFRGWIHWYSLFYNGRRTDDDARQIKRWQNFAGKNGRFRRRLDNLLKEGKDSPTIRQNLLEWAWDTS